MLFEAQRAHRVKHSEELDVPVVEGSNDSGAHLGGIALDGDETAESGLGLDTE